jgi:general L-amino acid transport system permease protein
VTAYAFAALFYFAVCFSMARYAGFIERRLAAGDAR